MRIDSRRRTQAGGFYVIAAVIALLFVAPLLVAALRSLLAGPDVTAPLSVRMLRQLTLENYTTLLGGAQNLLPYVRNSAIVALGAAVLATVSSALAGYVFARVRSRLVTVVFLGLLAIFMVPFQALVIPLLSLLQRLGLSDSWSGLILVHATYALPFCVFIMRNTFVDIPRELEEAARVDGCAWWQTLLHVLRPVVIPGLVSAGLFSFLFSWTEFLGAVTFLCSRATGRARGRGPGDVGRRRPLGGATPGDQAPRRGRTPAA
jgi:multiple sugar transport system permease protein